MMRLIVFSLFFLFVIPINAQRQEKACQIAARVNGDIITQQAYLAVLRDYRQDFSWPMLLHGKSQREIDIELEQGKPSLLDDLIDELLLAQRGKELGFDPDVELKRIDEVIPPGYRDEFPQFDDSLRKQGIDFAQVRESRRRQALGQRAIQQEVFERIYHGITENERRAFYESNKQQFMLPATVTLSEVFLPFLGISVSETELRALKLLAELRAGADFFKAVSENIPKRRMSHATRGLLGTFRLSEIKDNLAVNLANLRPGEFTMLRLDDGDQIIRLDARIPATARSYEDPETRAEISRFLTMSRGTAICKGYVAHLREKARIEICPDR